MILSPRSATAAPLLDADAMRRWAQYRARGRSAFLWRVGVLRLGLPMAALTVCYKLVQEQGLTTSPILTATLRHAIELAVVGFPLCGYLLGGRVWDTQEASYSRTLAEHPAGPASDAETGRPDAGSRD